MIDIKRAILYALLMLVLYTLWVNWEKDYPSIRTVNSTPSVENNTQTLTPMPAQEETHKSIQAAINKNEDSLLFIKTDVLKVGFNIHTGDLVDARFMAYKENLDDVAPFVMLNDIFPNQYITSTRLFGLSNKGILQNTAVNFDPKSFHVTHEANTWIVTMQGVSADELIIKKTMTLKKGSYLIDVHYDVTNESKAPWKGEWTTQISQSNPQEDKSSLFHLGSYSGAAISIPGDKLYKKISYADMEKSNLDQPVKAGWIAMQQHYFLTAWIPPVDSHHKLYSQVSDHQYTMGVLSEPVHLASKENHTFTSQLYIGPELMDVLKQIAPGLDLTIDYGWLSVISVFLFYILQQIESFVGNWGWSIILVTVLIKLAFYRLSAKSYTSMANMRKLQPKIEELKQRFGDDKTKMSQATMELYRKEKVNPLGGCLPIVVQIPVFIALYWVLLESVQLRQAPFIFWIHDLSIADPYYILPVIMGITMFIQQKLNPPPPDPTQAKMMMFLPIVFTGLFLHFPAGLVLYWVVNNTLSIIQQWYITQKISNAIIEKRFSPKKLTKK